MDRLFVPLNSEPWNWFRRGDKTVEIRGVSPRFNQSTVKPGRLVELRKGYSGPSIWGRLENVSTAASAAALFNHIEPGHVVPGASRTEAVKYVEELLPGYGSYIAFSVSTPITAKRVPCD